MLSGCASNTYYFPVVKKPAAAPVLEKKGKIDITYSVAYVRPSYADAFSSDAAEQDEKKHRKLIYDKLKKSGLLYKMRITEKGWNDSFYRVMFIYTNILILLNK